jgi:ribose transport system permease protein
MPIRLEASSFLPIGALLAVLAWAEIVNHSVLSYWGLVLLLSSAVPLTIASLSQMIVIALGDIDVSLGYFVGLTNAITAEVLTRNVAEGGALLLCCVGGYMVMGLLIAKRGLPSIVVTLGASFIWLGLGEVVLPTPGGSEPGWLSTIFGLSPPGVPLPIVLCALGAVLGLVAMYGSRLGVLVRGLGSNAGVVKTAGWNAVRVRVLAYGIAGCFGVLAGLAVTGITASGDPTASSSYTLLSIAAVILGGGEFSGGRASPIGAVTGALTVSVIASVMGLIDVSSSLQVGAQGLVLMAAVAGRRIVKALER